MTREEAFKIINTEKECIKTCMQAGCSIECIGCDLSVDMTHLHDAYDIALAVLQEPERKHRYWARYTRNFGDIPTEFSYCSMCEALAIGIESEYCPNCGAIMDGEESNDTKSKEKETD